MLYGVLRQLALRLTGGGVDGQAQGPSVEHDLSRLGTRYLAQGMV